MIKKYFFLLIGLFIIFSCTDSIPFEDSSNQNLHSNNLKTRSFDEIRENFALREYNSLLASFKETPVVANANSNYPGYYGGAYVNDNNKLTILVTGNIENHRAEFVKRCGSENIVLEKCKFPFVKILNQIDRLKKYLDKNPNCNITGYALRDKENFLEVFIESADETTINRYKKLFSETEMLKFSKGKRGIAEVDIKPAGFLTMGGANNPWASVGFRASSGLKKGFVTAGHAYNVGDNVELNGISVGKCTKSQQFGSVDASFCEVTNSTYVPSNTIDFTSYNLSTKVAEAAYNTNVSLAGAMSGIRTGRVSSTSSSQIFNSIRFYDIVETDYISTGGDSGGLIFITGTDGVKYTGGIHVGVVGGKKYYSKANNVLNALGVARY